MPDLSLFWREIYRAKSNADFIAHSNLPNKKEHIEELDKHVQKLYEQIAILKESSD
ncbi:MAG: hypothetical protein MJZ37_07025 [Bacilli bacterium]|nr:hypothetical protein [Bacilli bacterium]